MSPSILRALKPKKVIAEAYKVLDHDEWLFWGRSQPRRALLPGKVVPRWDLAAGERYDNAIYYCTRDQLVYWLGPEIWTFEDLTPEETVCSDKWRQSATRVGRILERVSSWNKTTARLFVADCMARMLVREREAGRPPDPRYWETVDVARRYAWLAASDEELEAAYETVVGLDNRPESVFEVGYLAHPDLDKAVPGIGAWARNTYDPWYTERLFQYLEGCWRHTPGWCPIGWQPAADRQADAARR